MNEKLRAYVENLFKDAPKTRRNLEIKEELLSDISEKYLDYTAQGMAEEEAFARVASGIGDVYELLADLNAADRAGFRNSAGNRRFTAMIAIGVCLIVMSFGIMLVLGSVYGEEEIGAGIMMSLWGIAIGVIVYGAMNRKKYVKRDDTFVEEYREKVSGGDKKSRLFGAAVSAMWMLLLLVYFAVSFASGEWDVTWIIFLVGAVLTQVIHALVHGKASAPGLIWCSALVLYFVISFTSHDWHITWLIFIGAAGVQQMLRLYKIWRYER